MFVVIFRAKIRGLDPEYLDVARRLRDIAHEQFGCIEFQSITEGEEEISLSYWPDEESIQAWKKHPEHVLAQEAGRERWYESYTVQVARLDREYRVRT